MFRRVSASWALVAFVSIGWVACGGESGSATTGSPSGAAPGDNVATFERLQTQLFTPTCATSGCHAGTTPQGGLTLTADVAYQNLVNALPTNSNAVTDGLKRVAPGNTDMSLLYRKLVFPPGFNAHDYGNPMPTGTAGVTVGQLEYVRQWIAAGAPKTGNVADATLLANKSLQTTPPFVPLAAPAVGTGIQLKVSQFDVSANFERELFTYRKMNNSGDIYVSRIETSMRPFSHHFVLYTFDPNTPAFVIPQSDSVRDIRAPDGGMIGVNMIAMGYHVFFAGSMTQQSNYVFPAGMALKMSPNAALDLNVHYANHTGNQVPGEAYVNLYTTSAASVQHALSTLNLNNTNLTLPAGKTTVADKAFTFANTTTVIALTSHMHARGTKFQIKIVGGARDGELVYENTDWEHPQIVTFATPIVLQKGQGLRSIVTYVNNTASTISFGLTSDQEMDIIFGYFY